MLRTPPVPGQISKNGEVYTLSASGPTRTKQHWWYSYGDLWQTIWWGLGSSVGIHVWVSQLYTHLDVQIHTQKHSHTEKISSIQHANTWHSIGKSRTKPGFGSAGCHYIQNWCPVPLVLLTEVKRAIRAFVEQRACDNITLENKQKPSCQSVHNKLWADQKRNAWLIKDGSPIH